MHDWVCKCDVLIKSSVECTKRQRVQGWKVSWVHTFQYNKYAFLFFPWARRTALAYHPPELAVKCWTVGWHQHLKTIQDNPWNKQDQHSQQKQDDTWMTDDPSNISHLTLTMKNTSDTLPKTNNGYNWCSTSQLAQKQVSYIQWLQQDPCLQWPQKLKGRSKLSSPHESAHHKLDISPAHGHDKIWTMEGKNRCRWGSKLAECRRKRKKFKLWCIYTCFILFSGLCTNFISLTFLSKVPQSI